MVALLLKPKHVKTSPIDDVVCGCASYNVGLYLPVGLSLKQAVLRQ